MAFAISVFCPQRAKIIKRRWVIMGEGAGKQALPRQSEVENACGASGGNGSLVGSQLMENNNKKGAGLCDKERYVCQSQAPLMRLPLAQT